MFSKYFLPLFITVLIPLLLFAQQQTDPGWPRQIKGNDGSVVVMYQPQISEWNNYQTLKGDMAFALTPKNGKEVHGVASVNAATTVDKENRVANFTNITYPSIRFPSLQA